MEVVPSLSVVLRGHIQWGKTNSIKMAHVVADGVEAVLLALNTSQIGVLGDIEDTLTNPLDLYSCLVLSTHHALLEMRTILVKK